MCLTKFKVKSKVDDIMVAEKIKVTHIIIEAALLNRTFSSINCTLELFSFTHAYTHVRSIKPKALRSRIHRDMNCARSKLAQKKAFPVVSSKYYTDLSTKRRCCRFLFRQSHQTSFIILVFFD